MKVAYRIVAKRMAAVIDHHQHTTTLDGPDARKGILSHLQQAFQVDKNSIQTGGVIKATVEDMYSSHLGGAAEVGGMLYVDLAKFYDSIPKESIECSLRARKVPERLIAFLLEVGYEAESSYMAPPLGASPPAELAGSIRQGAPESPIVSLFVLEGLLSELAHIS
eukprot:SAG31_NODE_966_length_10688_cov_8.343564_12_plen_165_part_00